MIEKKEERDGKINDGNNFYNNNMKALLDNFGELLLEDKSLQRKNIEILNEKKVFLKIKISGIMILRKMIYYC